MSRFEIKFEKNPGKWKLSVHGVIDEDAQFKNYDLGGAPALEVDMSGIQGINSCGIRDWIAWISGAGVVPIELHSCPKVIVDQINMVKGFLPPNGRVMSFFVPFYSDANGSEKMVLYRYGKEFSENTTLNHPADVKDDQGNVMEIDVVESKYFKFLS